MRKEVAGKSPAETKDLYVGRREMIHVLIGAVGGAVISTVATATVMIVQGRRPTWNDLTVAAIGGALGGAVTAATLGLGSAATVTTTQGLLAFSTGGAVGAGSSQISENIFENRPVQEDVLESTLVGGVAGAVTFGASKVFAPIAQKLAPRANRVLDPIKKPLARLLPKRPPQVASKPPSPGLIKFRAGLTGASNGSRSQSRGLVGALRRIGQAPKSPSGSMRRDSRPKPNKTELQENEVKPRPRRPRDGINLPLGEP